MILFVTTFFKRAPFVRLLIPWMAGLLCQWHYPGFPVFNIFIVIGICIGLRAFRYLSIARQYFWSPLQGALLMLLVMQVGAWMAWQQDVRHDAHWFGHSLNSSTQLICTVDAPLQAKPYGYKTTAQVIGKVDHGKMQSANGAVVVFIRSTDSTLCLQPGDRVICNNTLQPIRNSGNPGAFDYAQYMAAQNIFHQVWLSQTNVRKLHRGHLSWMNRVLNSCRQYCVRTFQRYIPAAREAGLGEALLIGYKDDLDKLLVQAYTQAGVVHIIAISGMHLLLLYEALLWLLQALPEKRFSKLFKAIFILSVLWGFALLTGGSASVLRATVMYTFITVERLAINRYTNRYNLLAASAFLLLCYQPMLLLDVGFQLSYLAVLSLMLFQRPIAGIWLVKGRVRGFLWNMTTTTLAAQVLTIPVSLYYFHQFPNLFLIANLLALTLSEIAMYVSIALLSVGWWPWLAQWVGKLLYGLLYAMNAIVNFISHLPYAITQDVYVNAVEVYCLYGALGAMAAWLLLRYKYAFRVGVLCCCAAALVHAYVLFAANQQRTLLVYNIARHTAIDYVQGRSVAFTGDTALMHDTALQQQVVLPARLPYYVSQTTSFSNPLPVQDTASPLRILQFAGRRMVIVQGKLPAALPAKKFKTDYILLSHNPEVGISQLLQMFDTGLIIFDASSPPYKIKQWKNDCEALTLRFFSVPEQGAFVVNF